MGPNKARWRSAAITPGRREGQGERWSKEVPRNEKKEPLVVSCSVNGLVVFCFFVVFFKDKKYIYIKRCGSLKDEPFSLRW